MRRNLSQATGDYLKTIYELTRVHGRASTNQIAESLQVTPASVTGMIKKLASADPPLVDYQKHQGVLLTEEGEKAALEIVRHHRLLEMFLHEKLGYEWDEVDAEADRLEHFISEEFEERIAQSLGNPQFDPHGDPIPTRDLHLVETTAFSLYEMRAGQQAVVQRVVDDDPQLLRYLSDLGLVPQVHFSVHDFSPFDENLSLRIRGQEEMVTLGPSITRQIFVDVLED
jgi:DtxR family Mn-dependent transcriptional regulator